MANKGPIIAAGAVTGALFFWRKRRKSKKSKALEPGRDEEVATGEVVDEEVPAEA